jgi:hypothetical protein
MLLDTIFHVIKTEQGSRFLRQDMQTHAWTEVSDNEAKNKIAHAMRDVRSSITKGRESCAAEQMICRARRQNEEPMPCLI